jgi:hypothetical protein
MTVVASADSCTTVTVAASACSGNDTSVNGCNATRTDIAAPDTCGVGWSALGGYATAVDSDCACPSLAERAADSCVSACAVSS